METVNPKNFIDIDPNLVSFITLKDGNMIMIDESTPAKPNKMKLFTEEENNKESLNKPKIQELTLSQQINFSFEGNNKIKENTTLNKKINFNISNNINFSFLKSNNINTIQNNNINDNLSNNKLNNYNNSPSPNSSIDIKSSMFQSKRNNIMNKNNMNNINNININNNALSEDKDNVNINLTETIMSNQILNNNGIKNDEIMPSNNFIINNQQNNKNNKKLNIIEDTQIYTFNDNTGNDIDNGNYNEKKDNIDDINNMKLQIKNNQNSEININNNNLNQLISNNNNNGSINNYNSLNQQINDINNPSLTPSLINQNHTFYSQNNYPNNMNINTQNNDREMNMDNNSKERRSSKKYNRINRIKQNKKDGNYVKAVVSINIPAEEQENINLVKQFNLLVDRLNGQKSKSKAKEIIKRSDRYYELYKTPNGNILKSLLNQENKKRQIKHNYYFDISNNISNTSKFGDISNNNIYNNDITNITYGNYVKNNNLNSRILALKEKSFTTMNNSFRNENNIINNYKNNNNDKTEIVLPSNFNYKKKFNY